MKKLLLFFLIAIGFAEQTNAMIIREQNKKPILVFLSSHNNNKDSNAKQSVVQEPLLSQLGILEGEDRKKMIKDWCAGFKKNSKKPVMWQKPEKVNTQQSMQEIDKKQVHPQEILANLDEDCDSLKKSHNFTTSDAKFYDRIAALQKKWNTWCAGMVIDTVYMTDKYGSAEGFAMLDKKNSSLASFVAFKNSGYYKKLKEGLKKKLKKKSEEEFECIRLPHELENSVYHSALQSLYITAEALKRDLHNQSYFQRLWNYTKRQNSWQALATIENEITWFEDQDTIVSPEKTVFDRGEEMSLENINNMDSLKDVIVATDGKKYLKKEYVKPSLTHRQVFTRSSMPRTFFEQIKSARE
ncbi:MAG TPA: hypothetical protein VKU36_02340 [Candidatus Babeliales bacterium]|nr:hypothetical protein [Candidatus Babeliales bacterium]